MIKFLHIKQNNQYNSLITKLDESIQNKLDNDDLIDIIEDIECINFISNNEPIKYINSFFNSNIESTDIHYDIVTIGTNYEKNQYYLLFFGKSINSTGYIKLDESVKNINMFGSKICAAYNNNLPIYGDVFIIGINKLYFDMYEKLNDSVVNGVEVKEKVENMVFDKIYYDYSINKLIDTYKTSKK
jgi:hypothetical protein